jgi:macrodomain Ter protein organizer (MatP/YcbG family)
MKNTLKRRKYISGAEKIHTSIYLLPRHRSHLEFLMRARGTTMNDCICFLIDQSIRSYQTRKLK